MKKIRCLAVDDEPLALALLADTIRRFPSLDLVATCDDPLDALDLLRTETIDLLFLDIQMPGLTGTQFLRSLPLRPLVIFVTAYDQFALEGFDLNVVDYLLKPVEMSRFVQAVQKATELIDRREAATETGDAFFVHADYSLVKIDPSSVVYVEGLKDYVKIYLSTQTRPVVTRITLKVLETHLAPPRFVRVHRSYIVNFNRIEAVKKAVLTVGNQVIPIGESYAEGLFRRLDVPK